LVGDKRCLPCWHGWIMLPIKALCQPLITAPLPVLSPSTVTGHGEGEQLIGPLSPHLIGPLSCNRLSDWLKHSLPVDWPGVWRFSLLNPASAFIALLKVWKQPFKPWLKLLNYLFNSYVGFINPVWIFDCSLERNGSQLVVNLNLVF